MSTGKTEDPFWEEMHRQVATHPTELARLEREVIEAAKEWSADWLGNTKRLRLAVRALEAFEANQK